MQRTRAYTEENTMMSATQHGYNAKALSFTQNSPPTLLFILFIYVYAKY